jgi:hypothetical protein
MIDYVNKTGLSRFLSKVKDYIGTQLAGYATSDDLNSLYSYMDEELSYKAEATHKHSASDITSGTLPIARGGTGSTTASAARSALGVEISSTTITMFSNAGYPIE